MEKDELDMSEDFSDKLNVFATNDKKLKVIGEILSNESSRNILLLLIQKEMASLQICKETGLQLSLVIHHLNKMLSVDLVSISHLGKSEKNHEMKYYRAKPALMVLPQNAIDAAKKSKLFSNSIKKILKFAGIGIAGLVSWLITKPAEIVKNEWVSGEEISVMLSDDLSMSIITGLSVVIIGLIIERVLIALRR